MILTEDALLPWRKKAYETFLSLGAKLSLPSPASKGSITEKEIHSAILPECADAYLVLVDGYMDKELSNLPDELICLPLANALKSYGLFLQNRWARPVEDSLSALNTALGHGAFLYVPQSCPMLQIIHVMTTPDLVSPRLQMTFGKSSNAMIVQTYLHLCPTTHVNTALDLALEANAHVQLFDVQLLPEKAWANTNVHATIKKDASFKVFHSTDGSQSIRFSTAVELLEENSSFTIDGLVMVTDERRANLHVLVDHAAPHCTSRQQIKMILNGNSKGEFEGKIYVRQVAQKTEAYQLNNNLILSDTATITTQPNLEIFADDVKASHGATISQLAEDSLFYLRARGIPLAKARALLTHAFCRELIDSLPIESLKQPLMKAMVRAIHA
jgi:Fe-S cluster assembly protein SufD